MSTGHRAQAQWLRGADARLVVAIYIARTGHAQFHAGLYHRDHGAASVLHFAWDRDLCNDPPDDVFAGRDYGLVALPLDEDDAQTLCALCRQVAERHSMTSVFASPSGGPGSISSPQRSSRRRSTTATASLVRPSC